MSKRITYRTTADNYKSFPRYGGLLGGYRLDRKVRQFAHHTHSVLAVAVDNVEVWQYERGFSSEWLAEFPDCERHDDLPERSPFNDAAFDRETTRERYIDQHGCSPE